MSRFKAAFSTKWRNVANHQCVRQFPIFQGASKSFLDDLVAELRVETFTEGTDIVTHGEVGDKVYFLSRGEASVIMDDANEEVATLSDCAVFGEMAFMGEADRVRCATVRAKSFCDCRSILFHTFSAILNRYPEERRIFERFHKERTQENLLRFPPPEPPPPAEKQTAVMKLVQAQRFRRMTSMMLSEQEGGAAAVGWGSDGKQQPCASSSSHQLPPMTPRQQGFKDRKAHGAEEEVDGAMRSKSYGAKQYRKSGSSGIAGRLGRTTADESSDNGEGGAGAKSENLVLEQIWGTIKMKSQGSRGGGSPRSRRIVSYESGEETEPKQDRVMSTLSTTNGTTREPCTGRSFKMGREGSEEPEPKQSRTLSTLSTTHQMTSESSSLVKTPRARTFGEDAGTVQNRTRSGFNMTQEHLGGSTDEHNHATESGLSWFRGGLPSPRSPRGAKSEFQLRTVSSDSFGPSAHDPLLRSREARSGQPKLPPAIGGRMGSGKSPRVQR